MPSPIGLARIGRVADGSYCGRDFLIDSGSEAKLAGAVYASWAPLLASTGITRPLGRTLFATGLKQESVYSVQSYGDGRVKVVRSSVLLGANPAAAVDSRIKTALAKVVPSTVFVRVVGKRGGRWSGSGVIVRPEDVIPGYVSREGEYFILTNHHVIAGGVRQVTVTTTGGQVMTAVVARGQLGSKLMDKEADIAVLVVKTDGVLPVAQLAPRDRDYEVGDTVMAVGYPFGLPRVVATTGRISQPAQATGESLLAIQSTAAINPGNSGGPLVDLDGHVIGLNTYTFKGADDTSFAHPIWAQLDVIRAMYEDGVCERGYLGITFEPLTEEDILGPDALPEGVGGAKVAWVDAGSEADLVGGLRVGDIVTSIVTDDGKEHRIDISNRYQMTLLKMWMFGLEPGKKVILRVLRREEDLDGRVVYSPDEFEIEVDMLSERKELYSRELGILFELDDGDIILSSVDADSPAGLAGVEAGKWALLGVALGGMPVRVRDLDELKDLLIEARQTVRNVRLYVEGEDKKRKVIEIGFGSNGEWSFSVLDDDGKIRPFYAA